MMERKVKVTVWEKPVEITVYKRNQKRYGSPSVNTWAKESKQKDQANTRRRTVNKRSLATKVICELKFWALPNGARITAFSRKASPHEYLIDRAGGFAG